MNIRQFFYLKKTAMSFVLLRLQASLMITRYKFKHWFFSWGVDDEGDVVFSIAKILHFVKYKEHTQVYFGKMDYDPAPKYVRGTH